MIKYFDEDPSLNGKRCKVVDVFYENYYVVKARIIIEETSEERLISPRYIVDSEAELSCLLFSLQLMVVRSLESNPTKVKCTQQCVDQTVEVRKFLL